MRSCLCDTAGPNTSSRSVKVVMLCGYKFHPPLDLESFAAACSWAASVLTWAASVFCVGWKPRMSVALLCWGDGMPHCSEAWDVGRPVAPRAHKGVCESWTLACCCSCSSNAKTSASMVDKKWESNATSPRYPRAFGRLQVSEEAWSKRAAAAALNPYAAGCPERT
jgi:hypothetical protein